MLMWQRRLKQQQRRDARQRRQDQQHELRRLAQGRENQDRDAATERENKRTELLAAQSKYTRGMLWANMLLATLTLVLAGIATWQAKLTQDSVAIARDSLEETVKSADDSKKSAAAELALAKRSLDAAVKSADDSRKSAADSLAIAKELSAAAVKSAAVAEQALKVQRAYLTVGTWSLKSPMRSGEPVSVNCIVQNVGPTQAILVSSSVATYIGERLPPEPRYKTLRDEGMVALGSQQTFLKEYRHTPPLTSAQFEAIQGGTQKFFTYGFVEYEDIFRQRQKAPFCVNYERETDRLNQCAQRGYHESWPTQTQPTQNE